MYKKIALFVGGAVFGSAGLKLLSSRDAKNAYVHATAAYLRMKDTAMQAVSAVQENTADIIAEAKQINEARYACEAEKEAEQEIESED